MKPLIRFKSCSFSYDKRLALKNASFTINEGEYIGMIGPNGGGKTTAINLVLGFLEPTSGSVSRHIATTEIGYLPQNPHFDKAFPISALEVVKLCAASKEEAMIVLERVGLLDFANSHFGTLSGGQAQRVLLARAIVSKPKLLILDEPIASVDPEAAEQILSILETLKGNTTILIVTHDFHTVVPSVDRLLCFQTEVTTFKPKDVCEHFALGLYHSALEEKK